MKVDFSQAIAKHLHWKIRMRDFLDGKESITKDQVVSHLHCDLGKWYYAEGKNLYGNYQTMKDFELEHEKLHKIIKEIVEDKEKGDLTSSRAKLSDLGISSDKIVSYLEKAENEINNA